MRRLLLFLFTIFLTFSSPVYATTQDCAPGETIYRPGDPEQEEDNCISTVPNEPHKNLDKYPLTCIPASSLTYTQVTTDPSTIPAEVIVNLTVDLSQAQLGGFGPSQSVADSGNPDLLAQKYLFNALFDKPIDLSSDSLSRESFRTYWRLLTSYQQATVKAIYLDQAKPHLANQILKLIPTIDPDISLLPLVEYLTSAKKGIFDNFISLINAIRNTATLTIDYSDVLANIEADDINLSPTINNHTITYYNDKGQEKTTTAKDLAKKLPLCLRTTPVCKNYQQKYLDLDDDTRAAYDALLPFNFDNTQSYLLLANTILEEHIPFLEAIEDGVNDRRLGLAYILSPSWAQSAIKKDLTKIKPGTITASDLLEYSGYSCSPVTNKDLLGYVDAPLTNPTTLQGQQPANLNQSITFTNLEQTGKEKVGTNHSCQGAYYCSSLTSESSCLQYSGCSWSSKPIYEYTYTAHGQGDPIIVLNSPLITNITNSLVSGANSLFKMLLPSYAQEPETRLIDAPTSDFVATSDQPNSSVSVVTSDGSNTMPIYRESNLAQDSICTLQNKWLIPDGLQRDYVCSSTFPVATEDSDCSAPQPYSPELDSLIAQAKNKFPNGAIHHISDEILKAIYFVEATTFYTRNNTTCTRNYASALGLMQITDYSYPLIVPPNQRLDQEENVCTTKSNVINRCSPVDTFELAARLLLFKEDLFFPSSPSNYQPLGSLTDPERLYIAIWRYYGSKDPDTNTINNAKRALYLGYIQQEDLVGGSVDNMNYADLACAITGLCHRPANY